MTTDEHEYYFIQNLSRNITRLRKERGIKQEELASAIGISKNAISNMEKKRAFPTLSNLDKMARYFQATPTQLFGSPQEIELEHAVLQTDEYSERVTELLTGLKKIEQSLADSDFSEALGNMTYLTTRQPIIDEATGDYLYWKVEGDWINKDILYSQIQIEEHGGNYEQAVESETPLEKLVKANVKLSNRKEKLLQK